MRKRKTENKDQTFGPNESEFFPRMFVKGASGSALPKPIKLP